MAVWAPESTSFQRSEAWKIATHGRADKSAASQAGNLPWRQHWVPYDQISDSLKRAVIASEDADFLSHRGVEWEAV